MTNNQVVCQLKTIMVYLFCDLILESILPHETLIARRDCHLEIPFWKVFELSQGSEMDSSSRTLKTLNKNTLDRDEEVFAPCALREVCTLPKNP